MNTLYAQRLRLSEELRTAEQDLKAIMQSDNPNPSILNFYEDLINRHRQLVRMIDEHLDEKVLDREGIAQ
jgi:hypothetical protein